MSRGDTWMPLYIGDYLADTMHLGATEHGAYLLLLMHQWRNGALLRDEKFLANVARVSLREWRDRVGPVVLQFFTETPEGLVQKRLEAERLKSHGINGKRAEAGRRGAENRWRRDDGNGGGLPPAGGGAPPESKPNGMANAMANAIPLPSRTAWQNDAPSPSPSESKKERNPLTPASGGGALKADFDFFYRKYPRPMLIASARRAWLTAIRRGADPAAIMAGLDAALSAKATDPKRDGARYWPAPAKWLRGGGWCDGQRPADPQAEAAERAEFVAALVADRGMPPAEAGARWDAIFGEPAPYPLASA